VDNRGASMTASTACEFARNFKTQEETAAEKAALEVEVARMKSGSVLVVFRLETVRKTMQSS
jgi:hypothetical protein